LAALAEEARPAVNLLSLHQAERVRSGHWRRRWSDRLKGLRGRRRIANAAIAAAPPAAFVTRADHFAPRGPLPNFALECFQNEYLAEGADDVNAIVTVKARGLGSPITSDDTDPSSGAVVMMIDVSGSMDGEKMQQACKAAISALDCIPDGARFAVIAGNQTARPVWPLGGMTVATNDSRAAASKEIAKLEASGGTSIGAWIVAATQLLADEAGVRQAILLTDGKDDNETPNDLAAAVAGASNVFQCDCRGVGTDWVVSELRGIAEALLGTVDIIADPADLTADFESIMTGAMRKRAPHVMMRVWTPAGAQIMSLKQVAPHILDLSNAGISSGPTSTDYPTASWGEEARDYHLAIRVKPGTIDDEILAARVTIVLDGQPAGQTLVRAIWTDDTALSTRINHRVALATGEEELAVLIDEAIQALNAGDAQAATVRFGRAIQLADTAGDWEIREMLAKVVDVEDASTGLVRLRRDIREPVPMTLDARSRKTTQVRTGTAASSSPPSADEQTTPAQRQDPNPDKGTLSSPRIGVLGPLLVTIDDGSEITISARKERALLELLAAQTGTPVSQSYVMAALWGDDSPRTAVKVIQTYVSALRRKMGKELIQTVGDGYCLAVPPDAVDAGRFKRLRRAGEDALEQNDPTRAVACFTEALALWRGDPLADLAHQRVGETEIRRLKDLRRSGEEDLFEARLQLGQHASLVAELEAAVADQPLRERRWEQLMLALYRAGRQADALRAYQRLRTTLQDQFAIDPREETRTLELSILNQDPGLQWVPPSPSAPEPRR
jgi:DNA-binding SARP family transcriptional activator